MVNFIDFFYYIYSGFMELKQELPEFMKNKVCLVTGATSGVGKSMAISLAGSGARVIMLSRNISRGEQTRDEIVKLTGNERIEVIFADLSLQYVIRNFADEFKRKHSELHIISNNIGNLRLKREETSEGIEMTLAVSYLSHFLLTLELIDLLKYSTPARIITVAGGKGVIKRASVNFNDIQMKTSYNGFKAAVQAALCRVLWTFELANRLRGTGVTANTFHPGFVKSGLGRHLPWILRKGMVLMQPFLSKTTKTGEFLATSEEIEYITGRFFIHQKPVDFNPKYDLDSTAKQLWQRSEELVNEIR